MKTGIIVSAVLLALTAPSLFAQTDPPDTGITFSVGTSGSDLAFRRMLPRDWALLATVGFSEGTIYPVVFGAGPSSDTTAWSLSAGARRYFRAEDLRPFAEATAGVRWADIPGCNTVSTPTGTLGGGVEYFIAKQVSIEGSAGLSYTSSDQRCNANGIEYRFEYDALSTFRTALSVTFYF